MQSVKHFLELQFRRLALLREPPSDEHQIRAWTSAMQPILKNIGEERFVATVERCVKELEFFPRPATFRDLIVGRTQGNFCKQCSGSSGWVIVRIIEEGRMIDRAVRCKHQGAA